MYIIRRLQAQIAMARWHVCMRGEGAEKGKGRRWDTPLVKQHKSSSVVHTGWSAGLVPPVGFVLKYNFFEYFSHPLG